MGRRAGTRPADKPVPVSPGARFPSAKRLANAPSEEGVVPERDESRTPSWRSEARLPREKQVEGYRGPEPETPERVEAHDGQPEPLWPSEPAEPERPPPYRPPVSAEPGVAPVEVEEISVPRARPYVLTRGRTHSSYELRLETMVSVRADAVWEGSALGVEYQPVRVLCAKPRSVAEVAALLSIPIGVARVLLSDLADLGVMHLHGTERTAEGRPPTALMRRVLDGLQKL